MYVRKEYRNVNDFKNVSGMLASVLSTRMHPNDFNDMIMNNDLDSVLEYGKFKDLDKGVDVIAKHVRAKNRIVIISDYDCDGVTSCVTLYKGLSAVCDMDRSDAIINKRVYGNGVNKNILANVLEMHSEHPIGLVITSDHGSFDEDRYAVMKENGMEIVVTDHHKTGMDLPSVSAFINPQQPGCDFDKRISGCVVAYIVMRRLLEKCGMGKHSVVTELLPFSAISLISDYMDMSSVLNRIIFKRGMRVLNALQLTPWKVIKHFNRNNVQLNETNVAFLIAPMINAAGRMGEADIAFDYLVTNDSAVAIKKYRELNDINNKRKDLQNRVFEGVIPQIRNEDNGNCIVTTEGLGINGIIASKVGELNNKPTVVLVKTWKGYVGSCRGILNGFSIHGVLSEVNKRDSSIIEKFGGHAGAAGCHVHENKLDEFRKLYNDVCGEMLSGVKEKVYEYDVELYDATATLATVRALGSLAPYGNGFPAPVVKYKGVVKEVRMLSKGLYMSFKIKNEKYGDVACFAVVNSKINKFSVVKDEYITLYGGISSKYYNGVNNAQISVVDVE